MIQPWRRGSVLWASLDTGSGREQAGRRPVVVVSSDDYLETVTTLAIVPVTTVDRGWPNHVLLRGPTGLEQSSWAMTEQPRTIDRARCRGVAGQVDEETEAAIDVYLRDFLDLP